MATWLNHQDHGHGWPKGQASSSLQYFNVDELLKCGLEVGGLGKVNVTSAKPYVV